MHIAIGCDHRGQALKQKLLERLTQLNHTVDDDGVCGDEAIDYPDIASVVAQKVSGGQCDRGILICGTGIGMSIAANKYAGVRAAPIVDSMTAEISRRHNDLNVLCLSGDMVGEAQLERIVDIWLTTEFEAGRHERRVNKIREIENHTFNSEAT